MDFEGKDNEKNLDKTYKRQDQELSEIRQKMLENISDFLSTYHEDIAEIKLLQCKQKEIRVTEMRKMLVEELAMNSLYIFGISDDYRQAFARAVMEIYNHQ
ncbi:hypothetical protein [Flagellimonas sp.]|uniref:hypothetical protein n=1 Tax=Flagellimonas sp. TaxID=2058762 RepID=UPI003BAAB097